MTILSVNKPIFTTTGVKWANELNYRTMPHALNLDGSPDRAAQKQADDELEAFFRDNMHELFGDKRLYVSLTPELLRRNVADVLLKSRVIIEVTPQTMEERSAFEAVSALRRRGYQLAFNPMLYKDENLELFKFVDYVRFPIKSDYLDIEDTVEMCREYGKQSIADGVDSIEDFSYAASAGIDYVMGNFYSQPIVETKRSGKPMVKTFLQILAMLYSKDPDIEQIAAIISTDPVLTIRLLRLINRLCEDTSNTISSVHQALVLLGLDKLKEWIYLVGLQRLNRDAPNELLRLALFRASFCENLARIAPGVGAKSKEVYLMGLISIVTGTEGRLLAEELRELPVSAEIKAGLSGGSGVFSNIFRLAHAYEQAEWLQVDKYVDRLKIDYGALNMVFRNANAFIAKFDQIN